MPTLTLEPDEVLPSTPAPLEGEASGPFSIFWRGKERQFRLRVVQFNNKKHVVFAREMGDETSDNWLLYERQSLTPAIWTTPPFPSRVADIALEFVARDWDLARIFVLPILKNNGCARVLLLGNGAGAWLEANQQFRVWATFDFDLSPVFGLNRSQLHQNWQYQVADADSKLGFAFHFASDETTRSKLTFGSHQAELFQVIQWVLRCEPCLWERGEAWDWKLSPRTPDFSYLFCPYIDNIENFAENLPFIYAMGRFLVEEHIPKITKSRREKHRCVREFLDSKEVWIDNFSEKPTAHERLEAALNLRDWLRQNDAPAELLALLNSTP